MTVVPSSARTPGDIPETRRESTGGTLFRRAYAKPILLAFLIAACNQLWGINLVICFAPRIFRLAGLDSSAALLLIGSLGYIASLAGVSWAFATDAAGPVVVGFVFLIIASHAVGQGAVIWVFIAEIFPNDVRTRGQSLGSGTHWVFAALITLVLPWLLGRFDGATIFGFFTAMMVLQLLFVLFVMPETKGRSLESLAGSLSIPEDELERERV